MGNYFVISLVSMLCSCIPWLATAYSTNLTDQSALLAFKARILLFDPDNILGDNWTTNSSFCDWIGVSCSHRRQRVTALTLANMGIGGTIEPQLCNLSFLAELDLSNNSFHGHLPNGLGRLARLKRIDLSRNQLDGMIPPSLSNCRKLEEISLSVNQFTGGVPSELGMLPNLRVLAIVNNSLNGTIPPSIGNLSLLQVLSFYSNSLQGSIPLEIGDLHNLRQLLLHENHLTGTIPSTLFNISTLQYLSLTSNSISGSLPVNIGYSFPNLRGLYLGMNQLSGQIPSSLCQCGRLEDLGLYINNFTGSLPREIGNLSNLRRFSGYMNFLTGTIPPSIGNLSNLVIVELSQNYMVGEIPQELGYLQNLQMVNFHMNYLTGSIPQEIFNVSTLELVGLDDNGLSGHLPSNVGNLYRLEELYLRNNSLSGPIPASITNASLLTYLDLAMNSFSGSVPTSLGNLQQLQFLNLVGNQLTNQPNTPELVFLSSLTNCRFLEHLNIGINQLNGILPDSIGNLSTSLSIFVAEGCQIRGSIPREIGNLSNLIALGFDYNDISGTIPSTIKGLKKLQRLHLEGNNLKGSIPNEICSLTQLGELDLFDNKLSGQIPKCIGNLRQLQELSISSNMLTSPMPFSLWTIPNLLILNLSDNSLHENLPAAVGNMKTLVQLDISGNRFFGSIPGTIGNIQRLNHLSFSQNSFQGPLPESLGNLVSLEYLDLSFNNLSGNIAKSMEKLLLLSYLNLSHNRLEGEIPSGGPFSNFTSESFLGNEALCGSSKFKVPTCTVHFAGKGKTKFRMLKFVLPTIVSSAIIFALLFLLLKRRMKRKNDIPPNVDPLHAIEHRTISYYELLQATNNFHHENLLGTGSFSSVYKATLSDGVIVAVKVLDLQLEGAIKSFDAECQVLRNVRHRNLVKVISSCSNLDFRALIMEYMPQGSLEKWLYSQNYFLNLHQRINIMIDIASALEYLHHNLTELVVHCDLKPSNVLLDEDMVAHVGDFGIAKILSANDQSIAQTKTLGSIGYVAPEYGSEGRVSTSCDVYSYGIMLMEMFTGKKPLDEMFVGELSLRKWVHMSLPNKVMKVVDKNLISREENNDSPTRQQSFVSIMELCLDCSRKLPEDRITMKEVATRLHKIKKQFLDFLEILLIICQWEYKLCQFNSFLMAFHDIGTSSRN
uniref:non-specific serine/threonine protein kinase n=1 Tax=Nelumbo nucifera TaxID=4432 RepID=A0A822ZM54_NELNU|nr:TPA_asm: hypothetical protein HUJ06_003780 [Nelumbo nucifera]